MPTRKSELEVEILKLSPGDRADLARCLIESLDETHRVDCEAEWIEEAERRYATYRQGLAAHRTGDEVFRDARVPFE